MSNPGQAAEYTAPTAEATPLQDVPPIPEPTGSASRDGAATAPPANLDGASPAATAPEAPVSPLDSTQRLRWMNEWARKNGLALHLEGEIGFGREAVTVVNASDTCPDYGEPYEGDDGGVWTPQDAYHKYQCVAVLGRGEEAELQMYEWMRWFDTNGYTCEHDLDPRPGSIGAMFGDRGCRMVKR